MSPIAPPSVKKTPTLRFRVETLHLFTVRGQNFATNAVVTLAETLLPTGAVTWGPPLIKKQTPTLIKFSCVLQAIDTTIIHPDDPGDGGLVITVGNDPANPVAPSTSDQTNALDCTYES
jgi:hypothetical protein